jgi:hypothetical protein
MQIRDMPVLSYRRQPSWPPDWFSQNGGPKLRGEIGKLKDAFVDVRAHTRCFLFMDHEGYGYTGTIEVDDPRFCPIFVSFLKRHAGKTLQEIGDLDLSEEINVLDGGEALF